MNWKENVLKEEVILQDRHDGSIFKEIKARV